MERRVIKQLYEIEHSLRIQIVYINLTVSHSCRYVNYCNSVVGRCLTDMMLYRTDPFFNHLPSYILHLLMPQSFRVWWMDVIHHVCGGL